MLFFQPKSTVQKSAVPISAVPPLKPAASTATRTNMAVRAAQMLSESTQRVMMTLSSDSPSEDEANSSPLSKKAMVAVSKEKEKEVPINALSSGAKPLTNPYP